MNHKKIISILLGLSVLGLIGGFILTEPVMLGICSEEERFTCRGPLFDIGQPLGTGALALSLVSFILLFLPKQYFTAWLKFAAWWIPLSILWIATTPTTGGSGMGVGISLDRELVIWWTSGIFIVVSLLIFIIKAVLRRFDQVNQRSK